MDKMFLAQLKTAVFDPLGDWIKTYIGPIFALLIIAGILGLFLSTELPKILERRKG